MLNVDSPSHLLKRGKVISPSQRLTMEVVIGQYYYRAEMVTVSHSHVD